MQKSNRDFLIIPLIHKVIHAKQGVKVSEAKCVQEYANDIECMGQLFKYLGLAVFDTDNQIGWQPTKLMMEVIVRRLMSPSKPTLSATVNHPFMLILLRDAALRQTAFVEHDPWLTFGVMEATG